MPNSTNADVVLLYVTVGNVDDATRIAQVLVGERLAACANILPGMQSIYHWEGKLQQDHEVVIILKTRPALADAATARVKALHSYKCPCVLVLPVLEGGNADYLRWLWQEAPLHDGKPVTS